MQPHQTHKQQSEIHIRLAITQVQTTQTFTQLCKGIDIITCVCILALE